MERPTPPGMPQLPMGALVVDPRLAAGRGEEFSATAKREREESMLDEMNYHLPMSHRIENSLDTEGLEQASLHVSIGEDNVGFRLLQKMGWKGKGLGKNEDGIVHPIGLGIEGQGRLGLGKLEQDQEYTNAENVTRKRLEVEIQADEDEERMQRRELQVEKEQRIREEVQAVLQKFFCEVCHKQYQNAIELEAHLGSYDHHHKKRLAEMRAMVSGRTKSTRMRREQRQLEKEMAGFNDQLERARRGQEQSGQAAAIPSQADSKARVDLTSQRSTIQFGFGSKKVGQRTQGISLSCKPGGRPQAKRPDKKSLPTPNIAAFGESSSDSEDGS